MGIYKVLIKKNGSVRLDCAKECSIEYMHFDGMSQLVNYVTAHNIEVTVNDVSHEK